MADKQLPVGLPSQQAWFHLSYVEQNINGRIDRQNRSTCAGSASRRI